MTANTLPHRLRTYLGGELGNEAADAIEELTGMCDALKWYREPTIEQIAQILAAQGLTIVSAADAEKVKRCDCAWRPIETAPKDAERLLVWCETDDGGDVFLLHRNKRDEWLYEGQPLYALPFWIEAKYWQPLPEPPKEASHD